MIECEQIVIKVIPRHDALIGLLTQTQLCDLGKICLLAAERLHRLRADLGELRKVALAQRYAVLLREVLDHQLLLDIGERLFPNQLAHRLSVAQLHVPYNAAAGIVAHHAVHIRTGVGEHVVIKIRACRVAVHRDNDRVRADARRFIAQPLLDAAGGKDRGEGGGDAERQCSRNGGCCQKCGDSLFQHDVSP